MGRKLSGEETRRNLNVLVVDDSAVVRQVLSGLLSTEQGMVVSTARDPIIALEKMKTSRPDVIVLDLQMPRMDGLTFLRKIMREDPIPVVVCTGAAGHGTDAALQAMAEGAIDVVHKPQVGLRDFLHESAVMLTDVIRAASQARLDAGRPRPSERPAAHLGSKSAVIAIGASTGGPEAVRSILDAMPADAPGVLVVQHMPKGFTKAFASRLDATSAIRVKEAKHGDALLPGCALLAPGNLHMRLVRRAGQLVVEVVDGPLVSRHRPSVDVLFRSVAEVAGRAAVGVLLTGMGDDGAEGLLEMKRAGAATVAQDERSCIVFGMPAQAIRRGAVDEVVALGDVPEAILRLCARRRAG
jgi:two-component system chemotaxis response regulator CheB